MLQPVRISGNDSRIRIEHVFQPHSLGLRCRPDRIERAFYRRRQFHGLQFQTKPACNDPGDIQHVLDELGLRFCVSFDGFKRARRGDLVQPLGAKNLDPAEDRVQRCSQFVRQSGQKLVFGAIRFLSLAIQPRIFKGEADVPCQLLGKK